MCQQRLDHFPMTRCVAGPMRDPSVKVCVPEFIEPLCWGKAWHPSSSSLLPVLDLEPCTGSSAVLYLIVWSLDWLVTMKGVVAGLVMVLSALAGFRPGKTTRAVPAVYVLGDSSPDMGNNNYLPGNDVPRANKPFHGVGSPGPRPTGRFSNVRAAGAGGSVASNICNDRDGYVY
ncbi:hypothetical protein ZWY2020_035440 [Hordeum vulgare]|nr:hypothetical protein ZWY2020_035440 [Hordeum vulgare]